LGGVPTAKVNVETRLRVESSGGEVLARETASDTATLSVTREAGSEADVGGSGSLTIETA